MPSGRKRSSTFSRHLPKTIVELLVVASLETIGSHAIGLAGFQLVDRAKQNDNIPSENATYNGRVIEISSEGTK